MQVSLKSSHQNFGMAKFVNKTLVWEKVAEQSEKYMASKKIMQDNFAFIKKVYPQKYLHTYEFGDKVTFKISSIKNHFLATVTPGVLKYKDSYSRNTPVGMFTGLKLCLQKHILDKEKQLNRKK